MIRFLSYRGMTENPLSRKVIGLDAFGEFPVSDDFSVHDHKFVDKFSETGGDGIAVSELEKCLRYKGFVNYDLVKGDINITLDQ